MDSADRATRFAEAISEGVNCLAIFLCPPTLAGLRVEIHDVLRHWEAECAPTFRRIAQADARVDGPALRSGLARLTRLAAAGPDASRQLVDLRAAVREVFTALRLPLPALPPEEAKVCELHGAACPSLEKGGA